MMVRHIVVRMGIRMKSGQGCRAYLRSGSTLTGARRVFRQWSTYAGRAHSTGVGVGSIRSPARCRYDNRIPPQKQKPALREGPVLWKGDVPTRAPRVGHDQTARRSAHISFAAALTAADNRGALPPAMPRASACGGQCSASGAERHPDRFACARNRAHDDMYAFTPSFQNPAGSPIR